MLEEGLSNYDSSERVTEGNEMAILGEKIDYYQHTVEGLR